MSRTSSKRVAFASATGLAAIIAIATFSVLETRERGVEGQIPQVESTELEQVNAFSKRRSNFTQRDTDKAETSQSPDVTKSPIEDDIHGLDKATRARISSIEEWKKQNGFTNGYSYNDFDHYTLDELVASARAGDASALRAATERAVAERKLELARTLNYEAAMHGSVPALHMLALLRFPYEPLESGADNPKLNRDAMLALAYFEAAIIRHHPDAGDEARSYLQVSNYIPNHEELKAVHDMALNIVVEMERARSAEGLPPFYSKTPASVIEVLSTLALSAKFRFMSEDQIVSSYLAQEAE